MDELPARTAEETLDLYGRILGCSGFRDLGRDVLAPLAREVGASSAVFLQFVLRPGGPVVDRGITFALNPLSLASYVDHFYRFDPVAQASRILNSSPKAADVVTLTELTDPREFHRSDYYHEFLHRYGINDVLGLFIPVRALNDQILCVGLHRQRDLEPFTPAESRRLRQLKSVVTATLSRLCLAGAMEEVDGAMDALAQARQPVGLVIFNGRFDVLHANEKGLADLGVVDRQTSRAWLEAIRTAAARLPADRTGPMPLDVAGSGLSAHLHRQTLADGAVRVIVTTVAAGMRSRLEEQCRRFDLSTREIEVAHLLGAGLSNDAIGVRLQISTRTVENHLRSMYGKARASSRTQFLAQMFGVV